jgi:hypothetical protein
MELDLNEVMFLLLKTAVHLGLFLVDDNIQMLFDYLSGKSLVWKTSKKYGQFNSLMGKLLYRAVKFDIIHVKNDFQV